MKIFATAAGLAALLAAGAANAATNLVINGSFESPLGSPWVYAGQGFGGADAKRYPVKLIGYENHNGYNGAPAGAYGEYIPRDNVASDSPDQVGRQAAYFVADNSVETLSQRVHLKGGRYKVGFSVYLPQNGVNNPVDAKFSGSIDDMVLASFSAKKIDPVTGKYKPKTWYEVSGVQAFAPGDHLISFNYDSRPPQGYVGRTYAADVIIDRVYAIAVPEPSAWALMIGGFGLAGAMIRRRKAMAA